MLGGGGGGGGGGIPIPIPGGKAGGGIGTIIIVVVLFLLFSGILVAAVAVSPGLGGLGGGVPSGGRSAQQPDTDQQIAYIVELIELFWGGPIPVIRQGLPRDQAGPVRRLDAVGMRPGFVGHGALLLPIGPEGLPGHRLLR